MKIPLSATIPEELWLEIFTKAPSYHRWQQEVCLSHYGEPYAFIGYTDAKTIKPIIHEVENDIRNSGIPTEYVKENLSKDGDIVGYLFQCLKCKKHRLHIDCS